MNTQQLLEQYADAAAQFFALHQRYITDAWGTFRLTGETYRQRGEKDWAAAQAALAHLFEQARASVPLLQRTALAVVMDAVLGMRIRLGQHFAEVPADPSIQEDRAVADQLWQELNRVDRELYRQLG